MNPTIHQTYGTARREVPDGTPIAVLHIGGEDVLLATGSRPEPDAVHTLALGIRRTAAACFRHQLPTPGELENAIMVVEDEVVRLRALTAQPHQLFTADPAIRDIAQVAGVTGVADSPRMVLTLEAVEHSFSLLAALTLGRPASSAGIPATLAFATALLILREFMHHLQFPSITILA